MTSKDILIELKKLGSENIRKIYLKHGANDNLYGVKVEDLKKIQKKVKKNYELSLELFDTGNYDAMYLAGLIADEKKMTRKDLQKWVEKAPWHAVSEYTVAWIAAESDHGLELGLEWIESPKEMIAIAGWSTLSSYLTITPDEQIDTKLFSKLLDRVKKDIHKSPNYVRYVMNGLVIAAGCSVVPLSAKAKDVAAAIGKVEVEMGGTACKVPDAVTYIEKVEKLGKTGKKKKMARC